MEWVIATLASLFAGAVDSIVGGGGLILIPALFSTFPGTAPATLFGTNKAASIWGTAFASVQYSRRVTLNWRALAVAASACFFAALLGAWLVTVVSPDFLRKLLPGMLFLLWLYTLAKKELGRAHQPRFNGRQEALVASLLAASLGFYDGFFGPGTGSLLVFGLVRFLGYDFLHASAAAKVLNSTSNLAALLLFAIKGHIWWHYALAMALANVAGSLAGSHLALKHGTSFVRSVFLLVVAALICKTGFDAFLR